MTQQAARMLGSAWRTLLALGAGVASGALLVAAFIYSSLGDALVFEGLFVVSMFYGAAIAAICVPVWMMLAKAGLDGPPAAAGLGFAATATFLLLTDAAGGHARLEIMAYTFLPYAICGSVAALVTWWVGRVVAGAPTPERPT